MTKEPVSIEPLGDRAILLRFGQKPDQDCFERIRCFERALERTGIPGFIESAPAYTTLAVYFDPERVKGFQMEQSLLNVLQNVESLSDAYLVGNDLTNFRETAVEVPVCYDTEFGPDLDFVAHTHGMTCREVVAIHSSEVYFVHMIGFLPGFPYLGGLSDRIATPRKESPRLLVAAGSVGIAGNQTGVYPIASPGGWQIIGRSPMQLFDKTKNPPCKIRAGDGIRFVEVNRIEFETLCYERTDSR